MSALAQARMPVETVVKTWYFPLAAVKVWQGGIAVQDLANNVVTLGQAGTALAKFGEFAQSYDNSAGSPGALQALVNLDEETRIRWYDNDSTITSSNLFALAYVKDDHTATLTATGNSVLGQIWGVDPIKGVAVVSIPAPSAAYEYGEAEQVIGRYTVSLNLAAIQAMTSGTHSALTLTTPAGGTVSAFPTNFRLLGAELIVGSTVTGGSLSAVTATVQAGSDAAGTILGSHSVFSATGTFDSAGSNPYPSRGGQTPYITLTATSDVLANATTGALTVNFYGAVMP